MSKRILLTDLTVKLLAPVPCSEYRDLASGKLTKNRKNSSPFIKLVKRYSVKKKTARTEKLSATSKKSYWFNAAAWLRVTRNSSEPVSLVLTYKDASGTYAVIVDEDKATSSHSLMLSGCVEIVAHGEIEYINTCCSGLGNDQVVYIDGLHVERIQSSNVDPAQLLTA